MKMKKKITIDDDLIRRSLEGEMTAEESEKLHRILESDPAAADEIESIRKIWDASSRIAEIDAMDQEGDWKTIRSRIKPVRRIYLQVARIAAVFILAALAGYMLYDFSDGRIPGKASWVVVNSKDALREITLPDGSNISLNHASSLSYPEKFKGRERLVRLDGEAYFDVARDEKRPFIIDVAGEAAVEVLGTSFNLRQDPGNKKIFLNVLTGKVAFYPKKEKKEARVLEKNEQAVYDGGQITKSAVFDLNFLSWKTRKLEFDNTPLIEVVGQLGRHYKKEFLIVNHELDSLSLTGIYKDEQLEDVLEEIGLVLDIKFTPENKIILVGEYE